MISVTLIKMYFLVEIVLISSKSVKINQKLGFWRANQLACYQVFTSFCGL